MAMARLDYKAVAYFLVGALVGCGFDRFLNKIAELL